MDNLTLVIPAKNEKDLCLKFRGIKRYNLKILIILEKMILKQ